MFFSELSQDRSGLYERVRFFGNWVKIAQAFWSGLVCLMRERSCYKLNIPSRGLLQNPIKLIARLRIRILSSNLFLDMVSFYRTLRKLSFEVGSKIESSGKAPYCHTGGEGNAQV